MKTGNNNTQKNQLNKQNTNNKSQSANIVNVFQKQICHVKKSSCST